jgi:hypothetical protein
MKIRQLSWMTEVVLQIRPITTNHRSRLDLDYQASFSTTERPYTIFSTRGLRSCHSVSVHRKASFARLNVAEYLYAASSLTIRQCAIFTSLDICWFDPTIISCGARVPERSTMTMTTSSNEPSAFLRPYDAYHPPRKAADNDSQSGDRFGDRLVPDDVHVDVCCGKRSEPTTHLMCAATRIVERCVNVERS